MERLKPAYLLAIIAVATMPAVAQQSALNEPNAGAIAVIGDVERCDTYTVPVGTVLTVRQAVMNAGLLSEVVNVTVIRSAQDHAQWTQLVSTNSADNGEPVERGDVLVVHSMSPLVAAVRKSAALRTDSGIFVLSLEQDGVVIGDVLQRTNNLPLADGQLRVICRLPGQAPIGNAELYHPIAHGDVISISRNSRTALKGFGNMAPMVSEWKTNVAKVARDPFIPIAVSSNKKPFTSSQPTPQPLQLSTSSESNMFLSIPNSELTDDAVDASSSEHEFVQTVVPALSISQSEDIADVGLVDNKVSPASESTSSAPVAPQEMQFDAVTGSTTSAYNPWNLLFIGGLLVAGTLILAGTLKPDPDDNTAFINAATKVTNSTATRSDLSIAATEKTKESQQQNFAQKPFETKETEPVMPFQSQTNSPLKPEKTLVAGHEWFSGDWHGQVISQGATQVQTEAQFASSATVKTEVTDTSPKLEVQATPGTQTKTLSDTANVERAAVICEKSESGNEQSEVESELKSRKADAVGELPFSDLEDLLQNRLPIDLCETQFPIRIALFGKPAGPRRLRIDAAHSAVPAPHISISAEKRRDQPVTETAGAASRTPASQMQTADGSTSSLDRALHFLQERTES